MQLCYLAQTSQEYVQLCSVLFQHNEMSLRCFFLSRLEWSLDVAG